MISDDCTAHQCAECGRFVVAATVNHHGADQWVTGRCAQHGSVDVGCVRISRAAISPRSTA